MNRFAGEDGSTWWEICLLACLRDLQSVVFLALVVWDVAAFYKSGQKNQDLILSPTS